MPPGIPWLPQLAWCAQGAAPRLSSLRSACLSLQRRHLRARARTAAAAAGAAMQANRAAACWRECLGCGHALSLESGNLSTMALAEPIPD